MSQPSVVVIGDALIDELHTPSGTTEHVGGAALNVAAGLATLGIDTTLVAMVGLDHAGGQIREHLADCGVKLLETSTDVSSRAVSTRLDGEPHYEFNEAAKNRHLEFDGAQRAAIAAAGAVVITCFPFDDPAQFALLEQTLDGASIIIDPNPRTGMMRDSALFADNFESLAARSLLVKVGDEDAAILRGMMLPDLVDRLAVGGVTSVIATAGSAGAALHLPGGLTVQTRVSELPGPIIDTMGAGDATLASVAASIVQDGVPDSKEAARALLRRAMDIAAATCRAPGATLRLPE